MIARKAFVAMVLSLASISWAAAASIDSAYSDIDDKTSCITVDQAEEGDGEWATLTCDGFMGFPIVVDYGDARESVTYGFTDGSDRFWESFDGFNAAGKKVEWRLLRDGDKTVPFATIVRWSVSDPEDPEQSTEVLVVSKVGQLKERQACVVGLVVATGNPEANVMARGIADEQVEQFACGDQRTMVGEPMPSFSRQAQEQ